MNWVALARLSPWALLALVVTAGIGYGVGYAQGRASVRVGELKAQLRAFENGNRVQAQIIADLQAQSVKIVERTKAIIKEIPAAVPDNRACDLQQHAVDLDNLAWSRP